MFGGPPIVDQQAEDGDPVGDYKLVREMAVIAERLLARPGQIVELDIQCPACLGKLVGRANMYTRAVSIQCVECTFTVSR